MAEDKAKDEKKDGEKAAATPEEEAGKKNKRKLILFIVLGVVLLAGVGAGVMMFLGSGKEEDHKAAEAGHEPAGEEAKKDGEHAKGEAKKEGEAGKADAKKEGDHAKGDAKKEGEGGKADPKKEGGAKKEGEAKEASIPRIDFGETMTLKPFHVNLGNPLENRYLRLEIALEYKNGEEQKKEIEARLPQLRDAILSVASRKTREFLLGPDGKDQLRLEILNRVNQYMDKKIEGVYITDLLIE